MSPRDPPSYKSRKFTCGWADRREDVRKIASRLRATARNLGRVEPELGALWPQFEARRMRPSDPGPVLEMSEDDLSRLIDRRGRLDPPAYPAPVAETGYLFAAVGGLRCSLSIWAECHRSSNPTPIVLTLPNDDPIWRDAEKGRLLLFALADAWDADWASASAFVSLGLRDDRTLMSEERPWMTWAKAGSEPAPHRLHDGGPPEEVRKEHGGQLSLWTWLPLEEPRER